MTGHYVKRTLFTIAVLSAAFGASPTMERPVQRSVLAIAHVTVVDVVDGTTRPDSTVLIEGNVIKDIRPSGRASIPPGAVVVDAAARFLIPGLWDMHAHLLNVDRWDRFAPLFLANGVTGLRDMATSAPLERVVGLRKDVAAGRASGPRFVLAGRLVDGQRAIAHRRTPAFAGV